MRFVGTMVFEQRDYGLRGVVTFIESGKKGIFNWGNNIQRFNEINVQITQKMGSKEELKSSGYGIWTRFLVIDDKLCWRWSDKGWVFKADEKGKSLPSSSLRRKEVELIRSNSFSQADKLDNKND